MKSNSNYRTNKEFEQFLEGIGGLENGWKADSAPIIQRGFFSVDNGWLGIIERLITDLIELGWNKQVAQVKEKFGGLRFYINESSDDIWKRIQLAEQASYITCEKCGDLADLRTDIGWYLTLCDEHYDELKNKKQ